MRFSTRYSVYLNPLKTAYLCRNGDIRCLYLANPRILKSLHVTENILAKLSEIIHSTSEELASLGQEK